MTRYPPPFPCILQPFLTVAHDEREPEPPGSIVLWSNAPLGNIDAWAFVLLVGLARTLADALRVFMRKHGPKGDRRSGRVLLLHNHVRHTADMPPGLFGFRIWYDYLDAP